MGKGRETKGSWQRRPSRSGGSGDAPPWNACEADAFAPRLRNQPPNGDQWQGGSLLHLPAPKAPANRRTSCPGATKKPPALPRPTPKGDPIRCRPTCGYRFTSSGWYDHEQLAQRTHGARDPPPSQPPSARTECPPTPPPTTRCAQAAEPQSPGANPPFARPSGTAHSDWASQYRARRLHA